MRNIYLLCALMVTTFSYAGNIPTTTKVSHCQCGCHCKHVCSCHCTETKICHCPVSEKQP